MSDFPEKKTAGDYVALVMKGGTSMIPVVGGAAVELIGLINTPLERRKVDWLNDIAERLTVLETNGSVTAQQLQENPEFITAITHATQIAIRNHEQEKLDALRNAVINTAKGINIEDNFRIMFLSYIDLMSPLHFVILKYFKSPQGACIEHGVNTQNYYMGAASQALEDCFPELRGRRVLYDMIYADLATKGLVMEGGLHTTTSGQGITQKRTTTMGDEFIRFVSET